MNAPASPPARRSPFRRALNRAWLVVTVALAVECAAFYFTRQREVDRHNANINRIVSAGWGRGAQTGQVWYELDGDRVKYAVFNGPRPAPRAGEAVNVPNVDLDRPYSAGRVWFNRSRTERIRVNLGSPHLFFCLNGIITREPLPAGFTLPELEAFMKSAESIEGVPGYQRWRASRSR